MFTVIKGIDGNLSLDVIKYQDGDSTVWYVPLGAGHRFEDIFDAFLNEGGVVCLPQ